MPQLLINIDVPDLDQAIRFYCAVLELRPARRLFGASVAELRGDAAIVYLLHKPAGSSGAAAQPRDYARHWTPVHLDLAVDDLDSALARARQAGAKLEGEITEAGWGRLARLADPFGHGLCLIQFSAAGYDSPDAA